MTDQERELRAKIAEDISKDLTAVLENCACLGRDAYGRYIENMSNLILNKIKFP